MTEAIEMQTNLMICVVNMFQLAPFCSWCAISDGKQVMKLTQYSVPKQQSGIQENQPETKFQTN